MAFLWSVKAALWTLAGPNETRKVFQVLDYLFECWKVEFLPAIGHGHSDIRGTFANRLFTPERARALEV